MYPEIHYKTESKEFKTVTIFGCYGESPEVFLPDTIDGLPVTRIADYGFAQTEEEEGMAVFLPDGERKSEARKRPSGIRREGMARNSRSWPSMILMS